MPYQILTDEDVGQHLTMNVAIRKMEDAFREMANGTLESPPRFSVPANEGALVFTAGAAKSLEKVIGFRVYDTFPYNSPEHQQLVVVYSADTGAFKGLVVGHAIGRLRTAAINGVAINYLARKKVKTLGVIGAGFQAEKHLEAALSVRNFENIQIFSRTQERLLAFTEKMSAQLGITFETKSSAEEVARNADVLLCTTNSRQPILKTEYLKKGAHISSIGPKAAEASELPSDIATLANVIVTDSKAQVQGYKKSYFLSASIIEERMHNLCDVITNPQLGRQADTDTTLFCSTGLAGTEVILANELLEIVGRKVRS